jgi:outer membrane receptor for ferrienterochelin and colicins
MEVVGERSATIFDYKSAPLVQTMTERELFKAACCNLSESFETNPSIDVSFTDAITGMKQIEMLGLAGTYSQITIENMPAVRGLSSVVGLTFLPGTWMQSIQVSKGVGSVANGYESITGQINVELRKPENEEEQTMFFNLFSNQDRRLEGNLNVRKNLSKTLSSMTLLHGSMQRYVLDENSDRFLDMPLTQTLNVLQRFHLSYPERFENQIGIQFVTDKKEGGTVGGYNLDRLARTMNPKEFGFGMNTRQLRIHGKTGYIFNGSRYASAAVQWSYNRYRQNALFNLREYNANEEMGYFNFLFQSSIDSTFHKYRLGFSFILDEYDETYTDIRLRRIERVPGLFLEYTYSPADGFTLIAGLRVDYHNIFGTFYTPRLHVRILRTKIGYCV